jgi:hypothetical protein
VTLENVIDVEVSIFNKTYDLYLIGTSTWGGDVICKSLRIDGEPEEEEVREWTQEVANAA